MQGAISSTMNFVKYNGHDGKSIFEDHIAILLQLSLSLISYYFISSSNFESSLRHSGDSISRSLKGIVFVYYFTV